MSRQISPNTVGDHYYEKWQQTQTGAYTPQLTLRTENDKRSPWQPRSNNSLPFRTRQPLGVAKSTSTGSRASSQKLAPPPHWSDPDFNGAGTAKYLDRRRTTTVHVSLAKHLLYALIGEPVSQRRRTWSNEANVAIRAPSLPHPRTNSHLVLGTEGRSRFCDDNTRNSNLVCQVSFRSLHHACTARKHIPSFPPQCPKAALPFPDCRKKSQRHER